MQRAGGPPAGLGKYSANGRRTATAFGGAQLPAAIRLVRPLAASKRWSRSYGGCRLRFATKRRRLGAQTTPPASSASWEEPELRRRRGRHGLGLYAGRADDYAEPPCSLLAARAMPRDASPKPVAETATWAARRSSSSPMITSRA